MLDNKIEALSKDLRELEPGFLPYPIFTQIARLTVNPILEIVPLRSYKDKIQVLLLKRDDNDEFWPGEFHTPGTNFRATDEVGGILGPLRRICEEELQTSSQVVIPHFVNYYFRQVNRGKELAIVQWIELQESIVGDYFDIENLPENIVHSQLDFIEEAVILFKDFKKTL